MAKRQTLQVLGKDVAVLMSKNATDYISLTDLAKNFNAERPADLISAWMRNADTLEFLEVWESLNNPDFNLGHLTEVKKDIGKNRFSISPGKWIELTRSIGLVVKTGRYTLEFVFWLQKGQKHKVKSTKIRNRKSEIVKAPPTQSAHAHRPKSGWPNRRAEPKFFAV